MLVPVVVALSWSPAKKPPTLTVALNTLVSSVSVAVAPEITETGVLFADAGLLVLSVKVPLTDVTVRLGALSKSNPSAAIGVAVLTVIAENSVGASVLLRLPL